MNVKKMIKTLLLFLLITLLTQSIKAQPSLVGFLPDSDEFCYFVAELSAATVSTVSFAVCLNTGSPLACEIGYITLNCVGNPACQGIVATITEKGCKFLVERVDDKIYILGKSEKGKKETLKEVYESLKTIDEVVWQEKVLK